MVADRWRRSADPVRHLRAGTSDVHDVLMPVCFSPPLPFESNTCPTNSSACPPLHGAGGAPPPCTPPCLKPQAHMLTPLYPHLSHLNRDVNDCLYSAPLALSVSTSASTHRVFLQLASSATFHLSLSAWSVQYGSATRMSSLSSWSPAQLHLSWLVYKTCKRRLCAARQSEQLGKRLGILPLHLAKRTCTQRHMATEMDFLSAFASVATRQCSSMPRPRRHTRHGCLLQRIMRPCENHETFVQVCKPVPYALYHEVKVPGRIQSPQTHHARFTHLNVSPKPGFRFLISLFRYSAFLET